MMRELEPISLPPLAERPLVSVLIRNYNCEQYVRLALESVLAQTYGNFEAVVYDDGSTDNSREIVQNYVKKDPRVRLVAQENGGVARAANTVFANSEGNLISFLDSDDLFKPSKLEKVVAAFRLAPRCGLYADPVQPISSTAKPLGRPFPEKLDQGWRGPETLQTGGYNVFPPMSGLSFRREVLSFLLPIPAQIKWLEDYYLAATARFFTETARAPECLTEYRIHESNRSAGSGGNLSSCLSSFDPQAHAKFVHGLEKVLPVQREFLRRFYGSEVAEALRLEDNPRYWDVLLGIRVLDGKKAGAVRRFSDEELIGHVARPAEKRLWRALMLLPRPIAKRAYQFWRTPSGLKSTVKTLVLPVIQH
jgi:glycosyltransferase involved in cell wall biosynthesis